MLRWWVLFPSGIGRTSKIAKLNTGAPIFPMMGRASMVVRDRGTSGKVEKPSPFSPGTVECGSEKESEMVDP